VAEGSATLPFFFYHIPGLTGCQVPIHEFYEQASELIPNFRGIKYSSLDLVSLGWCLKIKRAYPTHQMFWGCDEALPCALDYGLQAAIGSTYNFMAPIHHLIIASQTKGEREKMMDWLFVVQDYIKSSKKHSKGGSLIPVLKVTMSFMSGLEMGPVRLPLETLSEAERSSLLKDFDKLCLGENIEKAKLLL
jgi:N-acetylneuraminate lyase